MMKKVTSNYASRFRYSFITVLVILLGLMVSGTASAQTYLNSEQATNVLTAEYKAFVTQEDQMLKTASPAQLKQFQLKELLHTLILRNLSAGMSTEQAMNEALNSPRLKIVSLNGTEAFSRNDITYWRQFYTDLLSN
jgi:hypothetical protein